MSLSRRQSLVLLASALTPRPSPGQPARPTAPGPPAGPADAATRPALPPGGAAAVRGHCDGLLARAVRSPYGWGWSEEEPGVDLTRARPRGKPPAIDAGLTAAAGFVLHLGGEATGDAGYLAAAVEAARGTLAVQARTGQVRARGAMGAFGGTRDEAADVPDRRPTRAALALLLTVLASQPDRPDPRLKGPAVRLAHWLGGQQTDAGAWPTLYPPDAAKGKAARLLLLDDPDHRDTACAVLLAADVLRDRPLQAYFDRAADHLVAVRVPAGRPPVRALWPAACKLDGDPNTRQPGLPVGVDLLGTRHALEVLLAGYLLTLDDRYNAPLATARDALGKLSRDANGSGWHRRYDTELKPVVPAAADTRPAGFFDPPPAAAAPPADPRTPDVFALVGRSQAVGGGRLAGELAARVPIRRRLALVATAFAPDALLADPGDAAGAGDAGGGNGRAPRWATGAPGPVSGLVSAAWRDLAAVGK